MQRKIVTIFNKDIKYKRWLIVIMSEEKMQ